MKNISGIQDYIKGKVSSKAENSKEFLTLTQEDPDSPSKETMFTKDYWFGGDEAQQPDPWLPNISKTQRIVGFFYALNYWIILFWYGWFMFALSDLEAS